MKRLLPATLSGRLILTLLIGLLAAQLLGAAILLRDRASALYEVSGLNAVQRIAGIVRVLDRLDASARATILPAVNSAHLRVMLAPQPPAAVESGDLHAAHLRELLQRLIGDGRPVQVALAEPSVAMEAGERHGPGGMRPRFGPMADYFPRHRMAFQVYAQLADGAWASFEHGLADEPFAWPWRLLLMLAVLLASVIALTLLAVRWLTRPLAVLATAADELGRDMRRPPLPEEGPAEVRRAAAAFNTMQARLQTHLREREQMLAAVSHDLRTPITRLRLRAELIEDETLRAKFARDLAEMEAMTAAALDFLRGARADEPVQPVDVLALLESLQADMEETGHAVQVQGRAAAPYPARPLALKRCLANLIENAVKYGGRAEVRVKDSVGQLRFVVADNGPGIAEAEIERVFEPFYRVEGSRSRATGGVGLGLSVARDIARAHGGELTLRNRAGGGLEAILTLPR
ncbi:MAG: ATP-binding protein [Sulfuricaulis sp.]